MVTVREILRGAVTRFAPTAGIGILAILLAFDGANVSAIRPTGWLLLGGLLLAETAGFSTLLLRARYRLEAAADVAGRRSAIAGALAIVGMFVSSIFSQGIGLAPAMLIAGASGALAGGVTFWPWLRRRVDPGELEAWEAVDVSALSAPSPTFGVQNPERHVPIRDRDA